jgi:hypothetical protein
VLAEWFVNNFCRLSTQDLWITQLLIVLFLLESVLLMLTKRKGVVLRGQYLTWHAKYGLVKMTLIKAFLIFFLVYSMSGLSLAGAFVGGILISYGCLIALLLGQLIKRSK